MNATTDRRAPAPRVAIVGATGAVGRTLVELMRQRSFNHGDLQLVASERSRGLSLPGPDERERRVHDLEHFDFSAVDIAFFSAGTSVSVQHARRAAASGALVIDNTNAFRMEPDCPLVVPQVNMAAPPVSRIIGNPNCSTIPLVRLLHPLHAAHGLARVTVSTYQAASGAGATGIGDLIEESNALGELPHPAATTGGRFGVGLAYNVVPSIDVALESGFTLEEQKMRQEARRILGIPDLDLVATCVRVPVINGHSEAVVVDLASPATADRVSELFAAEPEVDVWSEGFPTPRTIAHAPDRVHVGRIRVDPEVPTRVVFWLVADNLRIGAALNALQIAEALEERASA